ALERIEPRQESRARVAQRGRADFHIADAAQETVDDLRNDRRVADSDSFVGHWDWSFLTPSPGTPGEGWGEGPKKLISLIDRSRGLQTLPLALSRSTGRGE